MQIKASLKHLHIAPRKVRLVANLVRGMEAKRALLELNNLPKKASDPILKLLKSAVNNAKNNFQLDEAGLYIKEIKVDGGPVFKKFMPRAFGRAAAIRKRTSHVSVILETKDLTDKAPGHAKSEAPVERDITAEDIKSDFIGKEKGGSQQEKIKKSQNKGFTRKIFSRKAI